jgi:hypothetical protein
MVEKNNIENMDDKTEQRKNDLSMNYSANLYQSPKVDPQKQEKREHEFPESDVEKKSNWNQQDFESKVTENPNPTKKPANENV